MHIVGCNHNNHNTYYNTIATNNNDNYHNINNHTYSHNHGNINSESNTGSDKYLMNLQVFQKMTKSVVWTRILFGS